MSGTVPQQPAQERNQAALQKAQELAKAAWEHEAAAREQEQEQAQELEQDSPDK
jgi:hypothetical protein